MPSKKVVFVVSDLHMGRGNRQDDFDADLEFDEFCKAINDYALRNSMDLTLILNGDLLELWEVVPDDQLEVDGEAEIRGHLFFPLAGQAQRDDMEAFGAWQIEAILRSHPFVAAGLARLLSRPRNRVVYLPGNHDHAMVNPGLQQAFRDCLDDVSEVRVGHRLEFGNFFEDPDLLLYVEHGCQFSAGESSYPEFTSDVVEAPGYYFLRFVWNRIQARSDRPFSDVFEALVKWVVSAIVLNDDIDPTEVRYLLEYFKAHRDGLVPSLAATSGLPEMYDHWNRNHGTLRATKAIGSAFTSIFKKNHASGERTFTRRSGSADPGGPYPIRNIDVPGRQTDVILESRLVNGYWTGIMSRYENTETGFIKLDPRKHVTVFMGHTHRKMLWELPVPRGKGVRYWDEGTWTKGHPYTYGWITNDGDVRQHRGIKVFPTA